MLFILGLLVFFINLGGPLINVDGQVIGINTTRADNEGISFAIRIDGVLDVIEQLCNHTKAIRPFLGIKMITLNNDVWSQLLSDGPVNYIPKTQKGVLITSVAEQSPASEGGLIEGDVIVKCNGHAVDYSQDVLREVGFSGSQVELTVLRRLSSQKDKQVSVKVQPRV